MIGSEFPDDLLADLAWDPAGGDAPADRLMGHLLEAYRVAEEMDDMIALAGLRLLVTHVGRAYAPPLEELRLKS